MKIYLLVFRSLATRWNWVVSFPARLLYFRERTPGTHLIGHWVILEVGLDTQEERSPCCCRESNAPTRYTDWVTSALIPSDLDLSHTVIELPKSTENMGICMPVLSCADVISHPRNKNVWECIEEIYTIEEMPTFKLVFSTERKTTQRYIWVQRWGGVILDFARERGGWLAFLSDHVYEEHLVGSLSAPSSVFEDDWSGKVLLEVCATQEISLNTLDWRLGGP